MPMLFPKTYSEFRQHFFAVDPHHTLAHLKTTFSNNHLSIQKYYLNPPTSVTYLEVYGTKNNLPYCYVGLMKTG